MGEVWKAHDANLDRVVAIKMLTPGALDDATTRERFRREALVLSRLSHPGVATDLRLRRPGRPRLPGHGVRAGGTLRSRARDGPTAARHHAPAGRGHRRRPRECAPARGAAPRPEAGQRRCSPPTATPRSSTSGWRCSSPPGKATGRMTQTGADRRVAAVHGAGAAVRRGRRHPHRCLRAGGDAVRDGHRATALRQGPPRGADVRDHQQRRADACARSIRTAPAELDRLLGECLRKDPAHRPASAAEVGDSLRRMPATGGASARPPVPVSQAIRAIAVLPFRNVSQDPCPGVLRRRDDRGDHLRPGAHQGAHG